MRSRQRGAFIQVGSPATLCTPSLARPAGRAPLVEHSLTSSDAATFTLNVPAAVASDSAAGTGCSESGWRPAPGQGRGACTSRSAAGRGRHQASWRLLSQAAGGVGGALQVQSRCGSHCLPRW